MEVWAAGWHGLVGLCGQKTLKKRNNTCFAFFILRFLKSLSVFVDVEGAQPGTWSSKVKAYCVIENPWNYRM